MEESKMEESKVVIQIKNVSKTYKLFKSDKQRFFALFSKRIKYTEKHAVDDVSFDIHQGESVALFGKNGAGKSTILKMITGVAYPTSGEVTVEGRVSALLELGSGFDQEMTGRENIYFRGQLCGLNNKEIAEIEDPIIDFAELGEYIDQPVRTYSSGMRARLGFGVNICINPEILIVDEALSVGDKTFREKCRKRVNEIIEQDNVTLLFVTHAISDAKDFCKRGIVMKNGKVLFDGNIDDAAAYYEEKV